MHGKDLKSAKTKTPDYLFTEMASCEAGSTLGKEEDLAIISGVLVSALVAILRPLDCLYWES